MSDAVTSLFDQPPRQPWRPRPWLAALLSAVVPGTGQLYAGRPVRALVISTLAVAWPSLVLLSVTPLGTAAARLSLLTMAMLLFVLCPAIDAWHLAQHAGLKPCLHDHGGVTLDDHGGVMLDDHGGVTPGAGRGGRVSALHAERWYVLAFYVAFVLFVIRPLVVAPMLRHVVQVYRVEGVSMSLTLQNSDRVIATPLTGPVRRRMVVVWQTDDGAVVTHRIVGMPGDRLEMRNFMLLVNGLDVEGSALRPAADVQVVGEEFAWQRDFLVGDVAPERYRPTYGDWGPIRVPKDRYFALGDNRYGSLDSRQRGFIRREQIVARVRWVFAAFDPKTNNPRLDRMGRDVP